MFDIGSRQVVAPNRIILGFKPDTTKSPLEIIALHGLQVVDRLGEGDEFVVQLPAAEDPFAVISQLSKFAEIDYAEPDFVTIGSHLVRSQPELELTPEAGPAAPEPDPFLKFQYAAQITQAVQAWQLASGSSGIKIAVLDEGVDVSHPDLHDAVTNSFDAIEGDFNQQPNPWDGHGTACAGLAVAIANNGLGIRGLGAGCSVMPVRIALSPQRGAKWTWIESKVVRAIDWAWQNGADVLSNSWIGGAPGGAIENAFERARLFGRKGRGCVVVVAAGNDSGPVAFPASLANVLAVSATNEFDQPKTKSSADGETWWGSNFGSQIDLAAPGVHNFTTDIVGAGGFNIPGNPNSDYVNNFNGTSSATPIVAGIAALVLSVNPKLKEVQVRRLLTQTADKVGQVVYTNGRNDQMGFGRINALRAIQIAPTFI